MLVNALPVAREGGVYGGGPEYERGHPFRKWAVDDVPAHIVRNGNERGERLAKRQIYSRVACDPADIGHAGDLVIWVHIETYLTVIAAQKK